MRVYLDKEKYIYWVDKSVKIVFESVDNFNGLYYLYIDYQIVDEIYSWHQKIDWYNVDNIPKVNQFVIEVDIIIPNINYNLLNRKLEEYSNEFLNCIYIYYRSEKWYWNIELNPIVEINNSNYWIWKKFISYEDINKTNTNSQDYKDIIDDDLKIKWINVYRWWFFLRDYNTFYSYNNTVRCNYYTRLLLHSQYYDQINRSRLKDKNKLLYNIVDNINFINLITWKWKKIYSVKKSIWSAMVFLLIVLVLIICAIFLTYWWFFNFLFFIIICLLFFLFFIAPNWLDKFNRKVYKIYLCSRNDFFQKLYMNNTISLRDIFGWFAIKSTLNEFILTVSVNNYFLYNNKKFLINSILLYDKKFENINSAIKTINNSNIQIDNTIKNLIYNEYYNIDLSWNNYDMKYYSWSLIFWTEAVVSIITNEEFDFKKTLY